MSDISHILLDLDGPLLDGRNRHYHCYRTILEAHGFKPLCIEEYWEKKQAMLNRRDLLNQSGAGSIYSDFLASWMKMIESPEALALDKVQDGAIDCLRQWKERGTKLTLVTMRQNKDALSGQLARMGLKPFLDALLVCNHADGGEGKAMAVRNKYPDEPFEETALWVGDTEADWAAARSLNCDIVLVSNGLRNHEYLTSMEGATVISSIASLKNQESRNDYADQ